MTTKPIFFLFFFNLFYIGVQLINNDVSVQVHSRVTIAHILYTAVGCLLEKAVAPHSSTLACKIPWAEEPGRLQSRGLLSVGTTERLHFHFSLSSNGEGNGNPLQCSCLENPRDRGAWWAAVCGVAQSQTRLT